MCCIEANSADMFQELVLVTSLGCDASRKRIGQGESAKGSKLLGILRPKYVRQPCPSLSAPA